MSHSFNMVNQTNILLEVIIMWNTKSDVTGWNLNQEKPTKTSCDYCKENDRCAMSTLLHCDYRKDGECTLCKER